MDYAHKVSSNDEGVQNGSHAFVSAAGLQQLLAVDVLTGKAKELAQNKTLRMPPLLEDASLGRCALSLVACSLCSWSKHSNTYACPSFCPAQLQSRAVT